MGFDPGKESQGYALFTGLTDVSVVGVNPTQAEAAKLGVTLKEEPVYTSLGEDGVTKKVRIDVYVFSEATKRADKMAFFLEGKSRTSSAGNIQLINDLGQSCYAESIESALEKYAWFKPQGVREAIAGEPDLVDFIKNLLSIGKDSVAKIDNIEALLNGNVAELKTLFNQFSDRKAQVLYYVRENDGNWYQGVYSRHSSRAGSKNTKFWDKHFEGNTNKPTYQNSYLFQEFNPMAISAPVDNKPVNDAPKSLWG